MSHPTIHRRLLPSVRNVVIALAAAILTLPAGLAVSPDRAEAAGPRPLFQLPFRCGETWRLSTYAGHDDYDIDMFATSGVTNGRPILASYGGTVVSRGYEASGGGNYIRIDHGNGWQTRYLHMLNPAIVSLGQTVRIGQQIGNVGSTGNSSGPHLHYEQLRDGTGQANKVESWFNGVPSDINDDNRENSVTRTSYNCGGSVEGAAHIYGVDAENHLTYTVVDAATGTRTHGAKTSAATLGFSAVAMATLNFNTILITSTAGQLWRVDVITNKNALVFDPPVLLGGGWTHDKLAYDGNGHLYGTYAGHLLRYNVTTAKPTSIGGRVDIDRGFTLKTLTATGPDWILGTVADGRLMSYKINGAGDWADYPLRETTWQTFNHMLSPGGGFYLAHKPDGSMSYYVDADPYNGTATDMSNARTIDTRGWTQTLLSAQPGTVS